MDTSEPDTKTSSSADPAGSDEDLIARLDRALASSEATRREVLELLAKQRDYREAARSLPDRRAAS